MRYCILQIHATVLAGTKLADGAAAAASGQVGGMGAAGPACSGQAYFVTDGRPCSLQAFVDDVLQGLGNERSIIDRSVRGGAVLVGFLLILSRGFWR